MTYFLHRAIVVSVYILSIELTLWFRIPLRRGELDTALSNKVCQWLVTGRWLSPSTAVSSTNKTDRHDIAEMLLKVTSNTTTLTFIIRSSLIMYDVHCHLFRSLILKNIQTTSEKHTDCNIFYGRMDSKDVVPFSGKLKQTSIHT